MAVQTVTYKCAGCGSTQQVRVEAGQQAKAPICCGQPMKEVSKK